MKNPAPMLLCAVLGAGVALAVVWSFAGDAAPPVRVGDQPVAPIVAGNPSAQLERIEQALGQLATKVDALDRRVETAVERMTLRAAVAAPGTSTGSPVIDEAAMQRALEGALDGAAERQQRDKYDKLDPAEMLAEVHRLQYEAKDPFAARQALDQLLARKLEPKQRARALTQLGVLQRSSGKTDDAEATLREVMQTQGSTTDEGAAAGYQLIWTVWKRDRREALGIADGLARDAQNDGMRLHARWTAAMLAHELNDLARARADYAALQRDCAGRPEFAGILEDVKKRLAGLDGK